VGLREREENAKLERFQLKEDETDIKAKEV